MIALAYTCHFNVIEIDRELDRGGTARRHVAGVVHAATLGVSFPLYAAFSLAGYATFGANVSGDLLTEWTDDGEMAVAQAAVAVVNALKYPLVGFALRGATRGRAYLRARVSPREDSDARRRVARGGRRRSGRRRGDEPLAREASDETLVASLVDEETDDEEDFLEENLDEELDAEIGIDADAEIGVDAPQRPASVETPSPPPRWVFAAALFALHALVAACAVRLRSLQLALDVVGAAFGSLVAFVLPGALFIAAFDPARGRGGADGLAWAAKTITAEDGRRVTVPRMRYRVLAWTLVAVGGMTSACGGRRRRRIGDNQVKESRIGGGVASDSSEDDS